MKMKSTLVLAAVVASTASTLQQVNAQTWQLAGNNAATINSKLGTNNSIPVRLFTKNMERMRLDTLGRVGIGTINPLVRFHVQDRSFGEVALFDGGDRMQLSLFENGVARGYLGSFSGNAADVDFGTGGRNTTGKLHLTIRSNPKLTIDTGGKVGIGTTTPISLLSVVKTTGGPATADFRNPSLGPHASWIHFGNRGDWYIRSAADNGTIILQDQSPEGRVSIGTLAPATGYKLSVKGKIICEEVRVALQASWPDYVFDDQYKLMNLVDLEKYIKENKHLPGIQPAQEIQKDGLALGEMQTLLMQKIEELTLHVIDLKKENIELREMYKMAAK